MPSQSLISRSIDHLVLPVASLDVARSRLGALGFTVASDARHPFGTANACVYFSDKIYLEPLAVASAAECEAAARAGNVFVARDQAFRFRRGDEGFSGIALASGDAAKDDATYRDNGLSGGPMLAFSRPVTMPDGTQTVASFLLSFASDRRSPDFTFFTCERQNPLPTDRSALEAHANGVTGIAEILFSEPAPQDFRAFLSLVLEQDAVREIPHGIAIDAGNATLSVLDPGGTQTALDIRTTTHSRGLRGQAIVFSVRDIEAVETLLVGNHVDFTKRGSRIVVQPVAGQSAVFIFEERS